MMNGAKAIAKKYNEVSLILRIVVGLVIGAVLALAVPGAAHADEPAEGDNAVNTQQLPDSSDRKSVV